MGETAGGVVRRGLSKAGLLVVLLFTGGSMAAGLLVLPVAIVSQDPWWAAEALGVMIAGGWIALTLIDWRRGHG